MAHSHYVMDLYFREDERTERLRREVLRLAVHSDDAALAEGKRIDGWKRTHHYDIRAIQTSARSADKIIFTSPVAAAPEEDPMPAVIALNDNEPTSPAPPA